MEKFGGNDGRNGKPILERARPAKIGYKDIIDEAVAASMCQAKQRGKEQFLVF